MALKTRQDEELPFPVEVVSDEEVVEQTTEVATLHLVLFLKPF